MAARTPAARSGPAATTHGKTWRLARWVTSKLAFRAALAVVIAFPILLAATYVASRNPPYARDGVLEALAAALVLVSLGVISQRLLLRPVIRLAETARALSGGRNASVPYVRRDDEVGQVARALATWRAAEASRRAIVEHLPIGLFILSTEGQLLAANPAEERLTGYSSEELRRMTFADLVAMAHPEDLPKRRLEDLVQQYVDFLSGESETYLFEGRIVRRDGSPFWGSLTLVRVEGDDDHPEYVVGMIQDVSERREKLEQAARVQRELLPDCPPLVEGYEVAGTCLTAEEVGGDFFDWHEDRPGTLTVTLGDVMGKGISGAILMAAARTALRASSPLSSVGGSVRSLADSIAKNIEKAGAFVTLFHGRLDVATGTVTYVDAGHGLSLVLRAGGRVEPLGPTAMPLGVLPGQEYAESAVTLAPGEALLVFSDGLLEVHPELMRPEGTTALLAGAAGAEELVSRLAAGAAATRLRDDVTVVVVLRRAAPPG